RRCCSSSTTISSPGSASPWTGGGRSTRRTAWGDARQPIPDPGPMPFWDALVETTFKAAGDADIDVLLVLRREFCRHQEIAFDEQRARVALARLLDDQSLGRVWLIDSRGATVGYVVLIFSYGLEFDGRDAYVDEIYLQEPYRGRGLGPKALLFAEGVCAALGVRALHLGVDHNNSRALAAYVKAGFEDRNHCLLTKRIATRSV